MTDPIKPPTPPQNSSQPSATPHAKVSNFEAQYGSVTAKPIKFLGMDFTAPEAARLWDAIIQQVNSQIQRDQARALKALKKLGKSSTDQGNDD